jgi:hypothetical protein
MLHRLFPWIGAEVSSTQAVTVKTKEMNVTRHNSQREIAAFLQALSSYPEHFEKNPLLSFEQHMVRVACENSTILANTCGR